jgi:Ala-tRNA(Pro) deacylase
MAASITDPQSRETALYKLLAEIGISWSTIEHPPVFTVDDSADIYRRLPGCHTKNLFLKDKKGGLWLAVVRSHLKVDLNALAKCLAAPRFSFGSSELLQSTLGITPGSVTPFALMNDPARAVTVVLDAAMLDQSPLNFHPLRNDRTTSITPASLIAFISATGHPKIITQIPEKTG